MPNIEETFRLDKENRDAHKKEVNDAFRKTKAGEAIFGSKELHGLLGTCESKEPAIRAWWTHDNIEHNIKLLIEGKDPAKLHPYEQIELQRLKEELKTLNWFKNMRMHSDAPVCPSCLANQHTCKNLAPGLDKYCENAK